MRLRDKLLLAGGTIILAAGIGGLFIMNYWYNAALGLGVILWSRRVTQWGKEAGIKRAERIVLPAYVAGIAALAVNLAMAIWEWLLF